LENKQFLSAEVATRLRLADMYSLDELELKILLDAKSETVEEIAQEFRELPSLIEARILRSIPVKLNAKTLAEARIRIQIEKKKRSYTLREDRLIIQNCKKMSYREIGLCIGRKEESIRQRVGILKRQKKIRHPGFVDKEGVFHRYYSGEDDEALERLYPSSGKKALAKMLNRSERSIQYRVSAKLKIKRAPPAYLSAIKIAKLLRVGQRTVVFNWINQGFLKGTKSGRGTGRYQEWRIEVQDFHNFIRDYYYLYEPKLVKGKFLRSIIKITPAGQAVPVCQAAKILGISKSEVQRRIKSGELNAYKNYAGLHRFRGFRWFVRLDKLAWSNCRKRE